MTTSSKLHAINFTRVRGVFWRYIFVLRKGGGHLADLFYWPLMDILIWGLTSVWLQSHHQAENLPLILMTGLIFWQVAWRGSTDVSVNLLQEFWDRNLVNLFSSPLKISEWCLGIICVGLFKLMITLSFGAIVVYALYALNVFTIGWAFLPFAALLLLFGWTIGFLAASAILQWGRQIEAIVWMMGWFFAPFSAVFYPVHTLPGWVQSISWCLPTTYIFEGMRAILTEGKFPTHYFWISLCLGLVYFSLSMGVFLCSFRKSQEKGLARLE
jgi:ABC-2 type transport system permease protein